MTLQLKYYNESYTSKCFHRILKTTIHHYWTFINSTLLLHCVGNYTVECKSDPIRSDFGTEIFISDRIGKVVSQSYRFGLDIDYKF